MDLNKLIKDLKKGNNTEVNLPLYAGALASSYTNQGLYMLAMDLTSDYDLIRQDESVDCEYTGELLDRMMHVVDQVIVREQFTDLEAGIREIGDVRGQILHKLDVFGDYTYFMQIYEYMLNRLDYRFKDKNTDVDAAAFADELLAAITSDNDVQSMNEKIQAVLGELPVRLTSGRFFDFIQAGCRCYTGVRNDMADAFVESIRKCARPLNLDNLDQTYDNLYEVCELLNHTDMSELDADTCTALMAHLIAAGDFLAEIIRTYIYLADISNDLLMILLTIPQVRELSKDHKKSMTVIKEFVRSEEKGSFLTPDEDIVGLLRELTDRQDVYQGEHMMLEDALYGILNDHMDVIGEIGLKDIFSHLHTCMQLATTAVLSETKSLSPYFTVDESYMNQAVNQLEKHFSEIFDTVDRNRKRAIMALTIGCLPVVFNSIDEIKAYIVQSLDQCRDHAEKMACVDMLRQMFLDPVTEVSE